MTKPNSMKLDVYVNYPGNCEQAFRFYEQHLGGKITMMMTHQQQPDTANVPTIGKMPFFMPGSSLEKRSHGRRHS